MYIASEGVNGQFSLPSTEVKELQSVLAKVDSRLSALEFNFGEELSLNDVQHSPFRKLIVKIRDKVLRDGLGNKLDWNDNGIELEPEDWHSSITSVEESVLLGIIPIHFFNGYI